MRSWLVYFVLVIAGVVAASSQSRSGYKPQAGFVPDAKTAIAVAEAVLTPIYGEKQIAAERPFSAQLKDGVWTVSGSLPAENVGGVAEIKIHKSDAAVIFVLHGK
jgi:hypothetical protein